MSPFTEAKNAFILLKKMSSGLLISFSRDFHHRLCTVTFLHSFSLWSAAAKKAFLLSLRVFKVPPGAAALSLDRPAAD